MYFYMMIHVLGKRVRRKDELSPSHYLVFGGKLQDSSAIKQLTFALSVNSLELICIHVKCYQKASAQQLYNRCVMCTLILQ